DYRCLSRWIKACDNWHDNDCQVIPVQDRQPHQVPAWVVDTEVAHIVPGRTVSRYVALSYVWHNDQQNAGCQKVERLLLKRSNLSDFQKPGYLNGAAAAHLPQVVKDTINLVRKLDEKYLWVDCLCIVQDDRDTRAQVECMGEFYSGAYLTIIGAASSGLFSMQRSTNKRGRKASSRHTPPTAKEHIGELYHSLFKSKWATRGWTFQEQILSKRAAIFVDGNMFWDCQRCVWDKDELFQEANAEPGGSFTQSYYEMARRMSSISWPDFGMYIEMVSLYNSRDLTYPQDALPAISGVLNSFSRNFASGFVSGLPRLFLDVALLWQPFSKANRRIAKDAGMVAPNRHLPSWSWCGWRCPVDPFSLRTGLTYLDHEHHQSGASTWRTQGLVQWSILSEDMQQDQRLDEPALLDTYKGFCTHEDGTLPNGWSRCTDDFSMLSSRSNGVHFTHISDTTNRFKHPVPINDVPLPTAMLHSAWPFLSCKTSRAFFRVGAILKPLTWSEYHAGFKASVFELPQFTCGPAFEDICHVLCLEDEQGRSAGLLRRMDDDKVVLGEKIELIAISSGSVSCVELESAFEERINRVCSYSYRHGMRQVQFRRVLPNDGSIHNASETGRFEKWKSCFALQRMAEGVAPHPVKSADNGNEYHFYNVLWIERKGKVAYRRAAGRVPKAVWEQNCLKPSTVVLG
ncbi:hypothetical protein CC86DRAFT_308046, partial [Ophiobolus disseminans]